MGVGEGEGGGVEICLFIQMSGNAISIRSVIIMHELNCHLHLSCSGAT